MGDSRTDDMSLLGEEEGYASSANSRAGGSLSVEGSQNQQEGEEPLVSEGKEWELVSVFLVSFLGSCGTYGNEFTLLPPSF